jgi:hypothetical protein
MYLPAAGPPLIGRERELAGIEQAARTSGRGAHLIVVHGSWSGGTSAVALEAAHRLADDFPDGQVYLDLRESPDPDRVVPSLLRMLGVPSVPEPAAAAAALLRGLSNGRRGLVVLDNVTDVAQVEPVLALGAGTVLVAGTHALGSLGVAHRCTLAPLVRRDAVTMVARLLDGRPAPRTGLYDLAGLCGCLPGVLRIAAARLIDNPDLPLEELVTRLRDDRRALSELDAPGASLRGRLAAVLATVSATARPAFERLGLPGEFSLTDAVARLEVEPGRAERALEELCRVHLLTRTGPQRYRMPRLVRLLGAERASPGP